VALGASLSVIFGLSALVIGLIIYRRRSRLGRLSPSQSLNSSHRGPTLLPFTFGRDEKYLNRYPDHPLHSESAASVAADSNSDCSDALTLFTANNAISSSFGDSQATKGHKEQSQYVIATSTTTTAANTTNAAAPSLSQYSTEVRSGSESGNSSREIASEPRGIADSQVTVSREEWVRMRNEVSRLRRLQLRMTQNSNEHEIPPPYASARNEGH
jgi:hypothetical protein